MAKKHTASEVAQALLKLDRVVILSHFDPDPDAYGSMCGLGLALEAAGKQVVLLNQGENSPSCSYIPGADRIVQSFPQGDEWEWVVACDCGDMNRIGEQFVDLIKAGKKKLINIDHHISNDFFGDINLVKPKYSSASEIVFEVLQEMGLDISAEVASCLYTGISADTGSFRYSSTTLNTFNVTAQLVKLGANPQELATALYGNFPFSTVLLQAEALRNMKRYFDNKVAEVVVTSKMYEEFSASPNDTAMLVEKIRDIEGVEVAVCIYQRDEIWKIGLRSKSDQYDMCKLATKLGGGGHIAAAAFRWKGELEELRTRLFVHLKEMFA